MLGNYEKQTHAKNEKTNNSLSTSGGNGSKNQKPAPPKRKRSSENQNQKKPSKKVKQESNSGASCEEKTTQPSSSRNVKRKVSDLPREPASTEEIIHKQGPVPTVVRLKETKEGVEIDKLDDIDHALHAADFYIGQGCYTMNSPVSRFVFNPETQLMEYKEVQYPHGLLKIFDEALVNAADNRHKGTKVIKVGVNTLQNAVWVSNDGPNFAIVPTQYPSRADPSKPAYQPELAFFHCKTSSAYRKRNRVTGGKYGLGAKLIGIFSKWCSIEMCDGKTYYYQKASDNMRVVHVPKIKPATKAQQGKPFLNLCFCPDLKLFYPPQTQCNTLDDTMINLFHTRVYDIAGTVPANLKVMWSLNKEKFIAPKKDKFTRVPVKGFKNYVKLFLPPDLKKEIDCKDSERKLKIGYHSQDHWEVCLIKNPWPFPVSVSFVNNINTYNGGDHVKYIQNQVVQYCRSKVEGVDARRVNMAVMLFVNATIVDPDFQNQSKDVMISSPDTFGSTCNLDNRFLGVVNRNGVMDMLKNSMTDKEMALARRDIGAGKRKPVHDIPNFRDALHAGTRNSRKCSLYFVEGVSAMELAEVGLSVLGNDYVGAFALKGKVINAQSSIEKLKNNKEFVNICRAMGLELGKETPRSQLRYGRVVIMTDQDLDGSHIKGLFIYLLRTFWPHLLLEDNFVDVMITPIVVARPPGSKKKKKKKVKAKTTQGKGKGKNRNRKVGQGAVATSDGIQYFYTKQAFEYWFDQLEAAEQKRWNIKYYKGLATSNKKEGRMYFRHLANHIRHFNRATPEDFRELDMAFSKGTNSADLRKNWLKNHDASLYIPYENIRSMTYQDFIHKDLIHFSWMTLRRNIQLCEDGFTPAARKCVWVFLQRKVTKDIKVATAQSWVDDDTNYHHGPDSLGQTIVRLAQQFVGKQNMNFLVPSGQFGSARDGGKTAGATRYIFTRLQPVTRRMFCSDDDNILNIQQDEGKTIEPMSLAPVLPQVLVNGAEGTATGYSSSIPTYKPEDLVEAVKRKLKGQPWKELKPWYHKFKGTIEGDEKGNFVSCGKVEEVGDQKSQWKITELPVGRWRDDYKKKLSEMCDKGQVQSFFEHHRNEDVCFEVRLTEAGVTALTETKDPAEYFKLKKSFSSQLNLLVLDSTSGTRIRTFATIREVFDHWYDYRLALYEKRRLRVMQDLNNQIPFLQSKVDFIRVMLESKIPLGQKKKIMCEKLEELMIPVEFHDSLLAMRVNSFSEERIEDIQRDLEKCQEQIRFYEKTTPQELWEKDLDDLMECLPSFWENRFEKDEDDEDDEDESDEDGDEEESDED